MTHLPNYVHIELEVAQSSKRPQGPCGDIVACERDPAATTVACVDGIGSGVRARIAARMCVSRLLTLLEEGFTQHQAVAAIARTMDQKRDPTRPYAAFNVARIRTDGMATVLGYEAPPPLLVSHHHVVGLPARPVTLESSLATESHCHLQPGDALLLMSDGITQAGLGSGLPIGWQPEGVMRFANDCLAQGTPVRELAGRIQQHARQLWQVGGDDCSVALAICQRGQTVNIFSGPPADRQQDGPAVRRFMRLPGLKVVCGGSTAALVARELNKPVEVEQNPSSLIAPPRYDIPGIDLVTEGAVTLNQVYNLQGEDIRNLKEDSGVTELCTLLEIADRVNLFIGGARNRANADIAFRQRGILSREKILPLIAQRLRAAGKLVVTETL